MSQQYRSGTFRVSANLKPEARRNGDAPIFIVTEDRETALAIFHDWFQRRDVVNLMLAAVPDPLEVERNVVMASSSSSSSSAKPYHPVSSQQPDDDEDEENDDDSDAALNPSQPQMTANNWDKAREHLLVLHKEVRRMETDEDENDFTKRATANLFIEALEDFVHAFSHLNDSREYQHWNIMLDTMRKRYRSGRTGDNDDNAKVPKRARLVDDNDANK